MKRIMYFIVFALLISCSENEQQQNKSIDMEQLKEGRWLMNFQLTPEQQLPVFFDLTKNNEQIDVVFINGKEKVPVKNFKLKNNKFIAEDPIFNSWYEIEFIDQQHIKGNWFKDNADYKVPFTAIFTDKNRFPASEKNTEPIVIDGKWKVDFSPNNPDQHYPAIGLFEQKGDKVTGTFITETGDYRFLEGNVYGNELFLSCFDGSHAFMFKASLENDSLKGQFWSGLHWLETWVAVKNEAFELTHPDSLTFLKDGYDKIDFSFENNEGELISIRDERYQNKVVLINIMGPWCPNCKDETAYLADLYQQKKSDGLEIIALSFDRTDDKEVAKKNIEKIKSHLGADYEFLLAGKASKIEAAKALPMLNHIMSYPTTIFIDKKGKVRKIRTGFYGPGTGNYHIRYIETTNDFIEKLLGEE